VGKEPDGKKFIARNRAKEQRGGEASHTTSFHLGCNPTERKRFFSAPMKGGKRSKRPGIMGIFRISKIKEITLETGRVEEVYKKVKDEVQADDESTRVSR